MAAGKVGMGVPGTGYGMIYGAIWESSVADQWEAVVMMMTLLSLADRDDIVWMGARRLELKTRIPAEVIETGLRALLSPDPLSHSTEKEGRRIVQIPWVDGSTPPESELNPRGFLVVNRARYKRLARTSYMRDYMRQKRSAVGNPSQSDLSGKSRGDEAKRELEDFRK